MLAVDKLWARKAARLLVEEQAVDELLGEVQTSC